MASNLPQQSAGDVKNFFDNLIKNEVTFPAAEIDATVGFFLKRGFDQTSANATSIVLLSQARNDGVPVFSLVDKLKGLTDLQLTQVIAQVLNAEREGTSLLGYRVETVVNTYEARNILV
jgi:hypothetical protein